MASGQDVRLQERLHLLGGDTFHMIQVLHLAKGAMELPEVHDKLGFLLASALQAVQILI